jgi:hypothetical protein
MQFFTKVCATFLFHPTSFREQKRFSLFLNTMSSVARNQNLTTHKTMIRLCKQYSLWSTPITPFLIFQNTYSTSMKPHSFQFPRKFVTGLAVNVVKVVCELSSWLAMSPTPTLYPCKSLQTMVHRKIGVHQEPQCLRFQNGPHKEHSLLPCAYQCLQCRGSSIPFINNDSIEPILRLCKGSSLYGPEFELQFNKSITKIIESDWHVTRDTKLQ